MYIPERQIKYLTFVPVILHNRITILEKKTTGEFTPLFIVDLFRLTQKSGCLQHGFYRIGLFLQILFKCRKR